MTSTAIENAAVVTMDAAGREFTTATVVVEGDRITGVDVDAGSIPADAERVDGTGCLLTPGLVNTHHHLYQWITRGLAADHTLFQWLTTLYPVWAGIDVDGLHAGARGAITTLLESGCTTTTDHHYVFPTGAGDLLGAEIDAATSLGVRFHPTRGSMDLSEKDGGLPPDSVVETLDAILADSAAAIDTWHDPSSGALVQIALAPCSPFSVTADLLRESAALARDRGVRLHTHLAETRDETDYCAEHFGCTPLQHMQDVGWTGSDVWFAHGIHFDDASVAELGRTGTAVAHCPTSNGRLGAGIARTRDLLDAGAVVGLGVDGAASNESARLLQEVTMALMLARAVGGPTSLSTREALRLATVGGARVLGRGEDLGSLAPGMLADMVLWDLTGPAHAGITDPVAALVLGSPPPIRRSWVGGRSVVVDGRAVASDPDVLARDVAAAHRRLLDRAG